MKKLLFLLILVILSTTLAEAYVWKTVYNPFTSKMDYFQTENFTGYTVVADTLQGNLAWGYVTGEPAFLTNETDPIFLNNNASIYAAIANIKLNEINNPNASKTFTMGGNTIMWTFTNPVGGMVFNMTGGWSGHVLDIKDSSSVPIGSAGDHLFHVESDRLNVIPGHFNQSSGRTALLVEGNIVVAGIINTSNEVYSNGALVCTQANGLCSDGWVNTSTQTSTILNVSTSQYFLDQEGYVAVSNRLGEYFLNYEWEFLSAGPSIFDPILGSAVSSGTLSSSIAGNTNHIGIIRLNDSATANGGYRIASEGNSFLIGGEEKAMFIFRPFKNIDVANMTVTSRFGFLDTTTSSQPTDGCYFEITNTSFSGRCRNNSGPSITNPAYTIVNNTWYKGTIAIESTSRVNFSLYDSSNVLIWSGNVSANIPIDTGRETGFGILSTESSTGITGIGLIDFDYMSLKIKRRLNR